MILEQNIFNKREFFDLFQKRFSSFSEKCPLFLRFTILDSEVLVYDLSRNPENKPFSFPFDFSVSEKVNIKRIKDYLVENCYPVFSVYVEKTRAPSSFEIQDLMVNKRVSFKEASTMLIDESTEKQYRVEKVFNQDNRISVRDLTTNESALYQLTIPVTFFMQNVFTDPVKTGEIFINKAKYLHKMIDKQEA